MMSLATSAADVALERSSGSGDHELKFSLPAGRVDLVRRLLDGTCRRDVDYPAALVWTIYYDTPDLRSLAEKLNSDYLKSKVRLRWYSDLEGQVSGPAFVEAKARIGNRRVKVRTVAPHDAPVIASWSLQDSRLLAFPRLLRPQGVVVGDDWQPVLQLRYRRDRFTEPVTRARVSLDADIRAAAVNHRFIAACDTTALGLAVLEIKGAEEELPQRLRPLLRLGMRQRSFSKYLAVYQHVTRTLS
jgi:hypothetical protein